jgi:hypothetical protein
LKKTAIHELETTKLKVASGLDEAVQRKGLYRMNREQRKYLIRCNVQITFFVLSLWKVPGC